MKALKVLKWLSNRLSNWLNMKSKHRLPSHHHHPMNSLWVPLKPLLIWVLWNYTHLMIMGKRIQVLEISLSFRRCHSRLRHLSWHHQRRKKRMRNPRIHLTSAANKWSPQWRIVASRPSEWALWSGVAHHLSSVVNWATLLLKRIKTTKASSATKVSIQAWLSKLSYQCEQVIYTFV